MDAVLSFADDNFKYIMMMFNAITLVAVFIYQGFNHPPKEHHILFVTAHPDDEAMFFGPTISKVKECYFVHILCLSGGETGREQELKASAIGVHKTTCLKHDDLIDGMKENWCVETIQLIVSQYVKQNNIKAIFTFDKEGISSHPNHTAIHYALSAKEVPSDPKRDTTTTIKIYYLESVNIFRKYSGLLQGPISLLKTFSWLNLNLIAGWRRMAAHESQFVWYRKLWVLFSRYTFINTFQLRRVALN